MALEAGLYHDPDPPAMAPVALQDFVAAVDTRLRALIRALRDPSYRLTDLPDLHAAERALTDALGAAPAQDGRRPRVRYRDAVLASEAERVTDSVDTMAGLLQRPAGTTRADPGRVAT